MFSIKPTFKITKIPFSLYGTDKELGTVRVWSSIGHGEDTGAKELLKKSIPSMLQSKVLISKFFAIDRLSASAIVSGKITTLTHELRDHSMESRSSISESFFSGYC